MVQWLRLHDSNAAGAGLSPDLETNIPHALLQGQKKKSCAWSTLCALRAGSLQQEIVNLPCGKPLTVPSPSLGFESTGKFCFFSTQGPALESPRQGVLPNMRQEPNNCRVSALSWTLANVSWTLEADIWDWPCWPA